MDISKTAIAACRVAMRPIIKWLLRAGVMYRDFAEMTKRLYVEVALAEYGIRGRPTNLSRVALLTGLDRKEARHIRGLLANDSGEAGKSGLDRLSRVLSGWHQDIDFLNSSRLPRPLLRKGKHPSFESLISRYGGDVASSTILKEFKRVGAVGEDTTGALIPLKRYYMPAQADPAAMSRSATVIEDLGETVYHNLFRDNSIPSLFEGRAANRKVAASAAPAFRAFLEHEAMIFLEKIDGWLTDHEARNDREPSIRLGLGVYSINSISSKTNTRTRGDK